MINLVNISFSSSVNPNLSSPVLSRDKSSTRKTAFSPRTVGNIEIRRSIGLPSIIVFIRPSCGFLVSVISICDITLIREISLGKITFGNTLSVDRIPSTRYLILNSISAGSIWISEASDFTAVNNI